MCLARFVFHELNSSLQEKELESCSTESDTKFPWTSYIWRLIALLTQQSKCFNPNIKVVTGSLTFWMVHGFNLKTNVHLTWKFNRLLVTW